MSEIHDEMRALAIKLIGFFGSATTATITRPTRSFDPLTGNESFDAVTGMFPVVVAKDESETTSGNGSVMDQRLTIYIPVGSLVPETGDAVTLQGRTGQFVVQDPVTAYTPDGQHIAFKILLAKIGG